MKNYRLKVLQYGVRGYVQSFSASGESFAWVVTASETDALVTTRDQALAIAAFLSIFGNNVNEEKV